MADPVAAENTLSGLLDLAPVSDGSDVHGDNSIRTDSEVWTYTTTIGEAFTIGPKVHGGTMQMLIARAARLALDDLADPATDARGAGQTPIAVASDYLAAPDPARVELTVTPVKRGRTVSLMHVELAQSGRVMVSSSVTLGRLDEGDPHHRDTALLDGLPPQPTADGIGIGDSAIGSVMHLGTALDLVLDASSFPALSGRHGDPVVRGWVRPKGDAPADTDFAVLVCDISPPVVMNLGLLGWTPTVQLSTYLRRRPSDIVGGWLRFAASTIEVGAGMFDEDHLVVDGAGAVVAQSRQLALLPRSAPTSPTDTPTERNVQ